MRRRPFPRLGALRRGSAADSGPSCRELVELITDYLEGTLAPAQADRVAAHLAACDGCHSYVAQMRETISVVGRVPGETVSPEMEQTLVEAFRGWRAS